MTRPLDVDRLRAFAIPRAQDSYDPRDVIIYALGVGAGLSPDVDELRFIYERQIMVLPTMALTLGSPGFWAMAPESGVDWKNILHGAQRLRLFRPLDDCGELIGTITVTDVADKGPGKPALVRSVKQLKSLSGELIAESAEDWVIVGAGGFGGERRLPDDAPLPAPEGDPHFAIDLPTARTQAMMYRLSGDRNPLHIDPQVARSVGMDQPILHGLCSMGVVGRALIHACCDGDASRLSAMSLRFTAPVLPGDTIRTEIWQDGNALRFRALVPERNTVVIDNGAATLDGFTAP